MTERHYEAAAWLNYIQESLPLNEAETMETHLYTCDACMSIYLDVMEGEADGVSGGESAVEAELPDHFTDRVMASLPEPAAVLNAGNVSRKPGSVPRRSTWLHYTVAAAITLLLMSSGVFQQLLQRTEHVSDELSGGRPVSVTQKIMKKAAVVLDELPVKDLRKGDLRP
ncbi:hypothetical protein [Paenibacillus gansuensis]|uniref:Zinc-finger domain-containing protein n=1 Tax=Paenibacillus gansuensis TaxID=306542 RepID=A0ABW5PFV7_9BACL